MSQTVERTSGGESRWKKLLPWGVSVGLHAGVAAVLALVLFRPAPREVTGVGPVAYSADSLPRRLTPRPMRTKVLTGESSAARGKPPELTGSSPEWEAGAAGEVEAGAEGEETLWREFERESGPPVDLLSEETPAERNASFFGAKSRAEDVAYVIDCSASLKGSFGEIRREMLRSIGALGEGQRFHIILFADGRTLEGPRRRLTEPTRGAKGAAAKFLSRVRPSGRTEPVVALSRAFSVLRAGGEESRLICLLTDGAFPDSARVLRTIRRLNPRGGVRINTYLYGRSGSGAGTLRRMARESGGRFTRVER